MSLVLSLFCLVLLRLLSLMLFESVVVLCLTGASSWVGVLLGCVLFVKVALRFARREEMLLMRMRVGCLHVS